MKYYSRANLYKASNVFFSPETCQAYSYNWWKFVDKINGQIVFNNYFYSPTTCGHQSKVRRLLQELGIKIDIVISAPDGLQNLPSAVKYMEACIDSLQKQINKPRTHKKTNEARQQKIKLLQHQILETRNLIAAQEEEAA